MPDGDDHPVSFGRWQEAHQALSDRIRAVERDLEASQWQAEIATARRRLDDLEEGQRALREGQARRRDRQWTLLVAFLTGLVLPLLVAAVVAVASSH